MDYIHQPVCLNTTVNKTSNMKKQFSLAFFFMAVIFSVSLVVSNFFETKLIEIWGISATGGLLLFPISYIINDCIAEVWGYGRARVVIWTAFLLNFFVVLCAQLVVWLPAAPYWDGQPAFEQIFGQTPRIAIGSFLAFIVGSFLNAFIMSKMKLSFKGKRFSLRAVVSTLVGESADSIIFFPIAFGGLISVNELLILMATQVVMKSGYEVIALPVTLRVVRFVKRLEGIDAYDEKISYNIFKIRDFK